MDYELWIMDGVLNFKDPLASGDAHQLGSQHLTY